MTRLLWDMTGNRRFEAGVDRGVLYLSDNSGVAWNGLRAVDESSNGVSSTPYYCDGVKYTDARSLGDFQATLKAFTYPDEFMIYDGFQTIADGLFISDQPVTERFGLSYRTLVGNDLEGTDHGYKIHILYNLSAVPNGKSYSSLTSDTDPSEFSWVITGVPAPVPGRRPTVHLTVDATMLDAGVVSDLEDILYGTEAAPPRLPSIAEVVDLVEGWTPGGSVTVTYIDNGDGIWTAIGPDDVVALLDVNTFMINDPSVDMVDANTFEITID